MTDDTFFRRAIDGIRAGEPTVKGRVYSADIMRGIAARAKWLMILDKKVAVAFVREATFDGSGIMCDVQVLPYGLEIDFSEYDMHLEAQGQVEVKDGREIVTGVQFLNNLFLKKKGTT